jgi:type 1 glutamine amidotransferase
LSLLAAPASTAAPSARPEPMRALVYHETTGFRHASIPYAIEQITAWGSRHRIQVTADQTSNRFTDEGLAPFDVVVWLSTVGGVRGDPPLLTDAEWAAFQRYMERGGGYAGIHAASDCCDESAWYGELLAPSVQYRPR